MRLYNHLEEMSKQDMVFAKKRLIKFITNIEHNISIMRKTKIADKAEADSLSKIYNEIEQKTKDAKVSIEKVEEMFEPDVMSKNILRSQMQSIEKQLQVIDDRLNKGFIEKTQMVKKLRNSLTTIWNKLQGIYKIIGR